MLFSNPSFIRVITGASVRIAASMSSSSPAAVRTKFPIGIRNSPGIRIEAILLARPNRICVLGDGEDRDLWCANCGTENKVGKASKQAAGIAFRRGDVRNSLVQVIGPISQNVRTTSGRHEGVHVITAKGEAAEELSQAVDLVHYRPGVLKHCDVEVTR